MPSIINPLITDAGLAAAIAADGLGLQLAITHLALGDGQYTPVVSLTALANRKEKVAVASGYVDGTGGFRINTLFPAWVGIPSPYNATEIGFYAGDPDAGGILFAVYSHTSNVIVQRNSLDYVVQFSMQLTRVPAGSVTVTVDPGASQMLAMMAAHESGGNPHSQYVLTSDIGALIAAASGDFKASVRAATTANIASLAGGAPDTVDGVTLVANDRILVKNQTTGSQNGIYVVTTLGTGANGTWTRATDADGVGELTASAVILVEEGTASADSQWMLTTNGTITIGTTALVFARKDADAVFGMQSGDIFSTARTSPPLGSLKANGAAISRTAYANLFNAIYRTATITLTIASPCVISWAGYTPSPNDTIEFTSTGVLPTGLVTATKYYVLGPSIVPNVSFQVSATPGGAAIVTTGAQSGIHTAHNAPFGIGDGATTFNVPDLRGEFIRGWDDSRAIDANRAFGSAQAQDLQPHTHPVGQLTFIAGGGAQVLFGPGTGTTTGSTGTTETRPRNVALLACIKY